MVLARARVSTSRRGRVVLVAVAKGWARRLVVAPALALLAVDDREIWVLASEGRLVLRPVVCLEQALRQVVVAHLCVQEARHLDGQILMGEDLGAAGYVSFVAGSAGVGLVVAVVREVHAAGDALLPALGASARPSDGVCVAFWRPSSIAWYFTAVSSLLFVMSSVCCKSSISLLLMGPACWYTRLRCARRLTR